jgi:hypothetical protein
MSANRKFIIESMLTCVKNGRVFQYSDPEKTVAELEKLDILANILKSVSNFESKLLSDLDVD